MCLVHRHADWPLVALVSHILHKSKISSFRGVLPAEESLLAIFSILSIKEGFLAEFIAAPSGNRNDLREIFSEGFEV